MIKVIIVAGARPNFMKIAPIIHAIHKSDHKIDYRLVHTGQHYDKLLSDNFFEDLNIPTPNYNLKVGSGSHATQTAEILTTFEKVLLEELPDLVLVVGDVNSTMACTIAAKKLNIKVAHVEAGIRSFDLTMPEEINRMVTDSIADYFFTTTEIANENLLKHGAKLDQIFLVGNTMIDTLVANLDKLQKPFSLDDSILTTDFAVMTLHRPSNVDSTTRLKDTISTVCHALNEKKVIFPIHPRTAKQLNENSIPKNLVMIPPMRYLEFIYLIKNASIVVTDSGGLQEETTFLNVPCITLRPNTERPETISLGSNILANLDDESFDLAIKDFLNGKIKKASPIPFWDGQTGDRIVEVLKSI